MSLATDRAKREKAGNKMARLLNAEDDKDEFYSTTYGGFTEEADDIDYKSESSDDDLLDSDFDVPEDDEVKSDDDDDQPKRKKRVVTKAYKEPKKSKSSEKSVINDKTEKTEDEQKETRSRASRVEKFAVEEVPAVVEKKSLRRSTALKSAAVGRREKERLAKQQHLKDIAVRKNVPEVRRLTQEELLEEAKITEEINLRALQQYQRLEIEKKKSKLQKQVKRGPMIRYQSITVPLIDDDALGATLDLESGDVCERPIHLKDTKCSRSFVTFTDEASFKKTFPSGRTRPRPRDKICPITGKLARYMDPLTKTPYADLAAFRVLRHLYILHLDKNEKPIDLLRKFRNGEIQVPNVIITS